MDLSTARQDVINMDRALHQCRAELAECLVLERSLVQQINDLRRRGDVGDGSVMIQEGQLCNIRHQISLHREHASVLEIGYREACELVELQLELLRVENLIQENENRS